jgi:uncharacterized protein (DUF1015 family)
MLCALYPQNQVVLHAFHRRVRGPVELPSLLDGLRSQFAVTSGAGPDVPSGTLGLYAAGDWYVLRPHQPQEQPGVAGLDVTMLDERVLQPLLGLSSSDPRLEFVPDLHELDVTLRECDSDAGVLFTLNAPGLEDLMSVAERHEVMSAKTTYVQPKPHTGIFLS